MGIRSLGLAVLVTVGVTGSAEAARERLPRARAAVRSVAQAFQNTALSGRIRATQAAMTATVRADATPVWRVFGMNARLRMVEDAIYDESNGHRADRPAKVKVEGVKAGDELRLTALMPVSGHTGQANVEQWKNTNTYELTVYHPDGTQNQWMVPAGGQYVTPHEFGFKLQKGETRLEFRPTATSVGGFMPGRRLLALQAD